MGYFNGNGDMPVAVLPLTGNEQIPASTNLPSGEQPQDEVITVQQLIQFAPPPVAVAYASTITLDAKAINNSLVEIGTLTGNVTFATPTNLVAGQKWKCQFTQDGTGSRTLTLTGAGTVFLRAGGACTLSTSAGYIDTVDFTVQTAGASPVILVGTPVVNYS